MRKFFDTNVFLYAFLDQGSEKKNVAIKLITDAVRDGDGWISTQVIREFSNVMLKKSGKSVGEVKQALALFDKFKVIEDTVHLAVRALEVKERYGTQYFDSVLIVTAEKGLCDVMYTEDLNDGQEYCRVKSINPFKRA